MTTRRSPVLILAAGQGLRMGKDLNWTAKALFPLNKKPLLSHIIERFDQDQTIYIACGYAGEDVKNYCRICHNSRKVHFIDIDPYAGPGSGPGRSALQAAKEIAAPFYLVCCDTLWSEGLPEEKGVTWLGASDVNAQASVRYCLVEESGGRISGLLDKPSTPRSGLRAFNGLAFVHDWELFIEGLDKPPGSEGEEVQLSLGFQNIMKKSHIKVQPMETWVDVGTEDLYWRVRSASESVLNQKPNELFFQENGLVIKCFLDETLAEDRLKRAQALEGVAPKGVKKRGRFLYYPHVGGEELSRQLNVDRVQSLLDWCDQNLWKPVLASKEESKKRATDFYWVETEERLRKLFSKSPEFLKDRPNFFSNLKLLLTEVIDGVSTIQFHGDLQTENIIVDQAGKFVLIDWRQSFGGTHEFGDIYYDLGKLRASLRFDFSAFERVGVESLAQGLLPKRISGDVLVGPIKMFCDKRGLSWSRVGLVEALIFLRMCPLHPNPLRDVLWKEALKCFEEVGREI